MHQQALRDSFSAVSKPNVASKYVGKLLKRSTRFTCFCTAQTSTVQQNFVSIFELFQNEFFKTLIFSANIVIFLIKFDEHLSEIRDKCQKIEKDMEMYRNSANICGYLLTYSWFFADYFAEFFEFGTIQKFANVADLETCCKICIFSQDPSSIQPRTSPDKIVVWGSRALIWDRFCPCN